VSRWTYEKAGVPHLKGDPVYNRSIVKLIRSTHIPGVVGNPTGFASLFDISKTRIKDPLLVSSTDGVGTKLEVAMLQKRHDTIGIDLVAMCVNDVITTGAQPFVFLVYYATGKLHPKMTQEVLNGVVRGCRQAGCALVGGETAIMPGFYEVSKGPFPQYDIAGFSLGLVDRRKLIDGKKIEKGDVVLGIASSGFHSNGFSLLRKIFSTKELKGPIGKQLLTPTQIYVKPVMALLRNIPVHGIANITGGGLIDNLPRIFPEGLTAALDIGAWKTPKLFQLVENSGNIARFEMIRTFNMGIGLTVVLNKRHLKSAQAVLKRFHLASWVIGQIKHGSKLEVQ